MATSDTIERVSLLKDAPGDAARRVALRRMRWVATSLLIAAAIIYLFTLRETRTGWMGWVNAGSEAAMIGALADWFAVTAIFRHPLGIPVPHTALVKRRKDELGRSLQQFVTNNFLTADIFEEKVREAHVAQRVAEWLQDPTHRQRVLTQAVRGARILLTRVNDADIRELVRNTIIPRLNREPLSPVAGAFLEGIVEDDAHRGAVDVVFRELHEWLLRHPEAMRSVISERSPAWTPRWVDKRIVDWAYDQALEWTTAVMDDPYHPARIALDELLARLADDLQHDEAIRVRTEGIKERVLANPALTVTVISLWDSIRDSLTTAMDDPDSSLWRRADGWLTELSASLVSDPQLRATVDDRVQDIVGFLVTTYGEELATVISTTVERWDADEASERIELFVGRDLQFIRINGTVVGALAGLLIHAISLLAHQL